MTSIAQWRLGILYVNRPDLLTRAVASMAPILEHCIIIDNADEETFGDGVRTCAVRFCGLRLDWPMPIWRPPVPLTFAQTQNWLAREARRSGHPWYGSMHTDAAAQGDTCERLVALAQEVTASGQPWGAIFTNYDALALYNTAAMCAIGGWDPLLPQYYGDNDCYRRLKLAGYALIDSGLPVLHEASSTIRSDAKRAFLNQQTFDLYGTLYARKWGGPDKHECWTIPWNGALGG